METINWEKGIKNGIVSGIIWGWIAIIVNTLTGRFTYEATMVHNLVAFSIGGATIGIVLSGFLNVTSGVLPFKRSIPKALLISLSLWGMLFIGGLGLSVIDPERYHVDTVLTIQGLALFTILGCILGILWERRR